MQNIILIGFMGSGKSSVGMRLAKVLHCKFVDTDRLIETRQGKEISQIFQDEGEESFREMELQCLRSLRMETSPLVISTGGGMPLREENRRILKELGVVVYLKAAPFIIYERLYSDGSRPLLQKEDPKGEIERLLAVRAPVYQEMADVVIETDVRSAEQVVSALRKAVAPLPEESMGKYYGNKYGKHGQTLRYKPDVFSGRVHLQKILIINGPNLNFLGIRDRAVYGTEDYKELLERLKQKGEEAGVLLEVFQSNHEGGIIDRLQDSYFQPVSGIVINPGAYTHYSYAIRDALDTLVIPKVEVHISNIMEREEFRRVSVTAPVCDKQIYGHGLNGYLEAIDFILSK